MIEGGSPNQLIRMGVTKNTLPVGTELVVEGYRAQGRHEQGRRPELHVSRRPAAVPRRVGGGSRKVKDSA